MLDYSKQLSKYIPENASPIISRWIIDTGCQFKITRTRKTKLGDYRAPYKGGSHQITVNHDLNPYSFLITTIHEFAHLKTWNDFKNKVKPHGLEWKENFKELMQPFIKLNVFPTDIVQAISNYMNNPAASSCTDLNLFRTLKKYDTKKHTAIHIEEIAENTLFMLENGRIFKKLEKVRKRFKCIEVSTNKIYLFHPLAEIMPMKD